MNNKDIIKWLKDLLKFRASEYRQAQEFNGFSSEDDQAFNNESKKIEEEIAKLEQFDCQVKPLSIDEAITHEEEIASKEDSACCQQHAQFASWLKELKDLKNQHAILKTDFVNFKKRSMQQEAESYYRAEKAILTDFLRIYDEMEMLHKQLTKKEKLTEEEHGFELSFINLEKLLINEGCIKIQCNYGDKFNVNIMEALTTREINDDEGYDPDDVVDILRSGWMMSWPTGQKMLRPVQVVVGK